MAYGQTLKNWHFGTPHPVSGPMSRAERNFWLGLIMDGAYFPAAGPKIDRIAYGAGVEPREERSGSLISKLVDRGGD
jgi:hypothetical protein